MPTLEDVRVILERTFGIPVAESDAQIVLDRLGEIASREAAQQSVQRIGGTSQEVSVVCSKCGNQTSFTIEFPANR